MEVEVVARIIIKKRKEVGLGTVPYQLGLDLIDAFPWRRPEESPRCLGRRADWERASQ
jgi:hypothetical protein